MKAIASIALATLSILCFVSGQQEQCVSTTRDTPGPFFEQGCHLCLLAYFQYRKTLANFTDGGPPFFPPTWPGQFCPLLSTAQAGGPPSVEIGWATKTIIVEDIKGHKMTSFFTCEFFGQFAVLGIFFSLCL